MSPILTLAPLQATLPAPASILSRLFWTWSPWEEKFVNKMKYLGLYLSDKVFFEIERWRELQLRQLEQQVERELKNVI